MDGDLIDPVWLLQQMTAEEYDALPENQCRGIEVVDGMIRPHPSPLPLSSDIARRIAAAIDASGAPHWRSGMNLDLRLRNSPLLNRAPDVMVFRTTVDRHDRIPVSEVLAAIEVVDPWTESADRRRGVGMFSGVATAHLSFPVEIDLTDV